MLDFKAIQKQVSFESVFDLIGFTMKQSRTNPDQWRGACPICQRAGDRAIVYTKSKNRWYCHGLCKTGGDVIYLVAHVTGVKQLPAAQFLYDHFMRGQDKPKPRSFSPRRENGPANDNAAPEPARKPDDYAYRDLL